jgi:hypothetical protein
MEVLKLRTRECNDIFNTLETFYKLLQHPLVFKNYAIKLIKNEKIFLKLLRLSFVMMSNDLIESTENYARH